MKRNSKVVALVLAMVLLVVVSVAGTYAYLTSKTNAVKTLLQLVMLQLH